MNLWLICTIHLCCFSIVSHSLNAQSQEFISEEGYYTDYELDHYPHFKGGNDYEFQLELKAVLNSCGFKIEEIKQISGSMMRTLGIPLKEWEGRTMLQIMIDEDGKFTQIIFYGVPVPSALESCFKSTIKGKLLNPALINLVPVKCKFSYLLIEQS